jgi:hypothetical protein
VDARTPLDPERALDPVDDNGDFLARDPRGGRLG